MTVEEGKRTQIDTDLVDARDGYVFISYKREECSQARLLRKVLLQKGIAVWWDEDIQCGQFWNSLLDSAVRNAGCVVVLWSKKSTLSRWVMHEASRAIDRGVYAPARIDLTKIESPFDMYQATDLLDWEGQSNHPGFLDLLARVEELLPRKKLLIERFGNWLVNSKATLASSAFALTALGVLAWQVDATSKQITELSQVSDSLQLLQQDVQEQYESTLKTVWDETNQITVDDIAAQIRFVPGKCEADLHGIGRDASWDLLVSVKTKKSAEAYADRLVSASGYYSSVESFKNPWGLTLIGYDRKTRGLGVGQFETYQFLQHRRTKDEFEHWRIGANWKSAVADVIWTDYEPPDCLILEGNELNEAQKEAKYGAFPELSLKARVVLYVKGFAVGQAFTTVVQVPPRQILVARFPQIALDAGSLPKFPE